MHSSTVTVAVIGDTSTQSPYDHRRPEDFEVQWYNGTVGAGGQNHQKTQNCARVKHLPSGIVRTAQTRSRQNSLKNAMEAIHDELDRMSGKVVQGAQNAVRKAAVGSGERSDKRRTYRFQDGLVHDHQTGRTAPVERVMAGRFELLWLA